MNQLPPVRCVWLHVEALAAETKADAGNVFRLMRALETLGVFRQVSPRVFANTPLSDCLRSDVPGSQRAFLQLLAPGMGMWDGYSEMLATLQTGKTGIFERWGYDLWEHLRQDPARSAVLGSGEQRNRKPA